MYKLMVLFMVGALGACSTLGGNEEYTKQLDAWARGQEAQAVAQAARFKILSDIADKCPPASESCVTVVGATAAVAVAGGSGNNQANIQPPAPPADWNQLAVGAARDVLVVAAPAYAQVAMNAANQVTAQVQSENQAGILIAATNATRDVAINASSDSTSLATAVVQSGQATAAAQTGLLVSLANILPGLRPNVNVARDYVSADNGSTVAVDASTNGNNRVQGNENNVDTKGQIGDRRCIANAAPATAQPSLAAPNNVNGTTLPSAVNSSSVSATVVSGAPTNNCGGG